MIPGGLLCGPWWFTPWSVVVYSVVPGGLLCNPCWFAMYFQLDPLWFPLVYSVVSVVYFWFSQLLISGKELTTHMPGGSWGPADLRDVL